MNTKKYITKARSALLSLSILATAGVCSAASLPLSFDVLDADINIGETFEVEVSTSFDALLEIADFAFEVDPLNVLPGNGILAFLGWTVTSPLGDGLLHPGSTVDGYGDFLDPVFGGNDVLLATLKFQAIGNGSQSVSAIGLSADFRGLMLTDPSFDLVEYDLVGSFDVQVVPDTASTCCMLFLALFGIGVAKRAKSSAAK